MVRPEPAEQAPSPLPHPAPVPRPAAARPQARPQSLVEAVGEYVGEPRPAAEPSHHQPSWLTGTVPGASVPVDPTALLFPLPREEQPAPPPPAPVSREHRPARPRATLGQSRRLGLGAPLPTEPATAPQPGPAPASPASPQPSPPSPIAGGVEGLRALQEGARHLASQPAPSDVVPQPVDNSPSSPVRSHPAPQPYAPPAVPHPPASPAVPEPAPPAPISGVEGLRALQEGARRLAPQPALSDVVPQPGDNSPSSPVRSRTPRHHPRRGADPQDRDQPGPAPPAADGSAPAPQPGPPADTPARATAVIPHELVRSFTDLHGTDISDVPVHRGRRAVDQAERMSARAFTRAGQVYLPEQAGSLDDARVRGLLAHELTHVVQQRRYGGTLPPENSPAGRVLEAEAVAAERFFRGDPGAGTPLLHPRKPGHVPVSPADDASDEPHTNTPASDTWHGRSASWTPEGGMTVDDGVQRAPKEFDEQQITEEFYEEINTVRREMNLPPVHTQDKLSDEELNRLKYRLMKASGSLTGGSSLTAGDDKDEVEPIDGAWLRGQIGLAAVQALLSPFHTVKDDQAREVRHAFTNRPAEDAAVSLAEDKGFKEGIASPARPGESTHAHTSTSHSAGGPLRAGAVSASAGGVAGTLPLDKSSGSIPTWEQFGGDLAFGLATALASPFGIPIKEEDTPQRVTSPTPAKVQSPDPPPDATPVSKEADKPTALPDATRFVDAMDDLALDLLSTRIYDRLRSRIRQELLIDRERAGVLTDFR
nr:DUF4157 domain-containing protein [Streptomyces spinoverrucosus]